MRSKETSPAEGAAETRGRPHVQHASRPAIHVRDVRLEDDLRDETHGREWFESWRRAQSKQVHKRIGRLKKGVIASALLGLISLFTLFVFLVQPHDEVLAFFVFMLMPTIASGAFTWLHARLLRARGIGLISALRARRMVTYTLPSGAEAMDVAMTAHPAALGGPFGHVVRMAMQDLNAIDATLARISPSDRELLPEVRPTAKALVDRIIALVPVLHDLDRDVRGESVDRLEDRIAQLEADPNRDSARERTLQLLLRQHGTLGDLIAQRERLLAQVESASLLLKNILLDLRKVGSAGVHASLDDVNMVTQEARALSREIGHILSAVEDVRHWSR